MADNSSDTHLNSALSLTILTECLATLRDKSTPRNATVRQKKIGLESLLRYLAIPDVDLPNQPDFQSSIGEFMTLASLTPTSDEVTRRFNKYWATLMSYVPQHLIQLQSFNSLEEISQTMMKIQDHRFYKQLLRLYGLQLFLEEGVNLSSKSDSRQNQSKNPSELGWITTKDHITGTWIHHGVFNQYNPDHLTITTASTFSYITIKGIQHLLDRSYLLLITDLIAQRCFGYFACIIANLFERDYYPSCADLTYLYSIGDSLTRKYGSRAYDTISLWEPLTTSEIQVRKDDVSGDNMSYRNNITDQFVESQGPNQRSYLIQFLKKAVLPWLKSIKTQALFQIFGLHRCWGHPTIDEKAGIKKLKSIACTPRTINTRYIRLIHYKFREYFCMNYYRKHAKWPAMKVDDAAPPTALIRALKQHTYVDPLQKGYNLFDWKYVSFEKTFSVPERLELSEVIADRATSLPYSKLREECMKNGGIGASSSRSVIIQWLDTNFNNPEDFLTDIDKNGFDPDECVIGVYPKEKELKRMARLFGLLTIGKRLYVVLTEALIADHILPYFPEITMTFDAVTLMNKIYDNTKATSHQSSKTIDDVINVIVNIDFQKWNSNMRKEETIGIFRDIDNLHGFSNVIARSHDMFTFSTLYLADGTITPINKAGNWINDDRVWTGHLGGIEGLRQKGWTVFSVVILKYVAELNNVKCQLMGQGDNQVLILAYKYVSSQYVRSAHNDFLVSLSGFLDKIGPPLKLEETWSSSSFFIYGKFPVYEGVPLSMSIKRLCKLSSTTNDPIQNLDAVCSSITANASAATASEHSPIIPYILGSFATISALDLHFSHPFLSKKNIKISRRSSFRVPIARRSCVITLDLNDYDQDYINKTDISFLGSLANFPSILGGFPVLQLVDLVNHGFPDPLSLALWSVKNLYNNLTPSHYLRKYLVRFVNPIVSPETNATMLCQDPTSLNLLRSSSAPEKVKRQVFDFLASDYPIKNKQFKEFMMIARSNQDPLCELLYSMSPLNPRVCNSLITSTINGRAQKMISKLNKSSTCIGLMKKDRAKWNVSDPDHDLFITDESHSSQKFYSFSDSMERYELNYINSVLYLAYHPRTLDQSTMDYCSSELAQSLRNTSWKKHVSGVTVAPPQELFLFQDGTGTTCAQAEHLNPEYGCIRLLTRIPATWLTSNSTSAENYPIGPYTPFFGTTTKNKVIWDGGELKSAAPAILTGILDMLCLPGWGTDLHSNLSSLIFAIFGSMTDLDATKYVPSSTQVSGTVEHRWQDKRTSHSSSLSILYHFATTFHLTPDSFKPQQVAHLANHDNFNIAFQAIYTWASAILTGKILDRKISVARSIHCHVQCPRCIMPINEEKLEINPVPQALLDSWAPRPDNPYCWVPATSLLTGVRIQSEDLVPRITDLNDVVDLPRLLALSSAEAYLSHFPVPAVGQTQYSNSSLSNYSLSVSSIGHLLYNEFFAGLIGLRVIDYIFQQCFNLKEYQGMTGRRLYEAAINSIGLTNAVWFKGLAPLLMNYKGWNTIRVVIPNLTMPEGSPPSRYEIWSFFQRTFDKFAKIVMNVDFFLSWIRAILANTLPLSRKVILSPIVLTLVYNLFHSQHLDAPLKGQWLDTLIIIRGIFVGVKDDYALHSNTNFFKILQDADDGKYNAFQLDLLFRVSRLVLNSIKPRMVVVIPDAVSKVIGMKTIPSSVQDISLDLDLYSNRFIHLALLPKGGHELLRIGAARAPTSGQIHYTSPTPVLLEGPEENYCNSIYKTSAPGTSASYKLLSVLKHLDLRKSLSSIIDTTNTIACLADGSGGYTLTCGRVFKQAKLFFNTFFYDENLSSDGINAYRPATTCYLPSVQNRIDHLEFTTDIISDLTDPNYSQLCQRLGMKIEMITCDAEGGTDRQYSNPLSIMINLLGICEHSGTKILIYKCFAKRLDLLYSLITLVYQYYQNVTIFRSYFSTIGNTEVFLLATGLRVNTHRCQIEVSRNEKGLESSLSITHAIPLPCSEHDIYTKITSALKTHFAISCRAIAERYSLVLQLPEAIKQTEELLIQRINQMKRGAQNFCFPFHLIRAWRDEMHLVKFSTKPANKYKPGFLSDSLMKKMCFEYLVYLLLAFSPELVEKEIPNLISNWYACWYATFDKKWGLCLIKPHNKAYFGPGVKMVALKDLITPKNLKKILSQYGLLRPLILTSYRTLIPSLHLPVTPFSAPHLIWWKHVNRAHLPLHYSPLFPTEKIIHDPLKQIIFPTGRFQDITLDQDLEILKDSLTTLHEAIEAPNTNLVKTIIAVNNRSLVVSGYRAWLSGAIKPKFHPNDPTLHSHSQN